MRRSPICIFWSLLSLAALCLGSPSEEALRPIQRHLDIRGASATQAPFSALVRKGTYKEGHFQAGLTWTRSQHTGLLEERHWTHLGREHSEVRVHNGSLSWAQTIAPLTKRPAALKDNMEAQFLSEGWLITDITLPLRKAIAGEWDATCVDDRTIRNRSAVWVKIDSGEAIALTYIFDQETGLILAVEFAQEFTGTRKNILAVPVGISRIEGSIIESGFDFYVDGQKYRSVRFDKNIANEVPTELTFEPPRYKEFWLR